ncbi:hypothetical protein BH10PLA1_BH10PLA1_00440 [soil metagenome]
MDQHIAADSLARLAAIVESSDDAIVAKSLQGIVTSWNKGAERIFGYTAEEMIGRPIMTLIPTDRADEEKTIMARIRAGERVEHFETLRQTKDGRLIDVSVTISPIRDETGKITGASKIARDITAQNAALAQLRELTGRQGAILESALDCIVSMDENGRVLEWNPAAERTFGYTRDEVLGKEMATYIIPPAMRDLHRAGLAEYLRTGEGPVLGKRLELTAVRKDGSEFPVEVSITRVPIDGPAMFTGQLRDISDRKRAEEALRESEERLRRGLDAGKTGTWDWDIPNNRVKWSERLYEFHGIKPGEFSERVEDFNKLVHPQDTDRVQKLIQESVKNRTPYEAEFRVVHPSGQIRWIATNGKVYYDAAGRPQRMLGATTDVTDRKWAEADRERLLESERLARSEAERASRMKDEFLATLSHELRTPLTAILGWSQLLRTGTADQETLSQGIDTIDRNARVQTKIIEDLLDMSRITSGKIRLDVQRVDVAEVIRTTIETVTPAADAKEIRLVQVLDPLAGRVSGDPSRLQQVLWNLILNAIKFTPKGGRVQVVLERVNSHVEISVIDTGLGIDAKFLPHVFDRFRQADSSTTRTHSGLGLGLAIVKQLVELHGGTVLARSAGEGKGSTFVVMLPLTPLHAEVESDDDRRHPTSNLFGDIDLSCVKLEGVRVLVVDDEGDTRVLVKRLLDGCQATVLTAAGAEEALALVGEHSFDVLVSDIGMPRQDGYWLIKNLRKRPADQGGNIPALALTAYARSEDRQRVIMAGYQMHLAKPVEPSELITMVASLVGRT